MPIELQAVSPKAIQPSARLSRGPLHITQRGFYQCSALPFFGAARSAHAHGNVRPALDFQPVPRRVSAPEDLISVTHNRGQESHLSLLESHGVS